MKKIGTFVALILILSALLAADSFAQRGVRWVGSKGWRAGTPYNRMYDPKTVETISGEVVSVDTMTFMRGMNYGVHLTVRADKETISVHLGPGWYVLNQDVSFEPKDRIEVKGSRITFQGKPAIIAGEVKKGEEVLNLRDENGFPAWSGWKSRQ
jgi:hypothetical protein